MSETVTSPPAAPARAVDPAARAFNTSILVSATRCLLTYVLFPWVLPLLGLAGDVGPAVGIVIGLVAIVCNVFSIRRFWRSRHPWRWVISVINCGVIGLLAVLLAVDIADLAS
jgi:hypothetical protein